MQGFLTVFAGVPGCGKTSMCNIISKVLGLNEVTDFGNTEGSLSRYIRISIERGWTSKRDFIGYYNPLTKAFEESNRAVYDGLRMLNIESKEGLNRFPFLILLDEANLSPMEYYWADFMNICDDLKDNHSINLGNDNIFDIPETLHFLATINNDHTTETLSPRLIDRAWVVTLPQFTRTVYGDEITDDLIHRVLWEDLKNVFIPSKDADTSFDRETQNIYEGLSELLKVQSVYISPRVDIAIHRYCSIASNIMDNDDYDNEASVVALDFAIAQKILPTIEGAGESYGSWLDGVYKFSSKNNLIHSAQILERIINKGQANMKYYRFFD